MYRRTSALALLLLLNAGCATTDAPMAEVGVPDAIKPGPHESLAFVTPANGVQIYECRASKDRPGVYEWAFVAPDAELFDRNGNSVGRHYAGPHWELADGSKVVASVKARIVVEGANLPVTPGADCTLNEMGVLVVPDILANAGGVIVSYFEWSQNFQQYTWEEEEVNSRLEKILMKAYAAVTGRAKALGSNLREAAFVLAIDRVVTAEKLRGNL